MNGRVVVLMYRHRRDVSFPMIADIRLVDSSNVADALSMEPAERVEEFRRFLARGDLGYFAYREGRVVHRAWARRGPLTVPTFLGFAPARIQAGGGFIHYCETAPSARGLGVYPAVLSHIVSDLRTKGIHDITIATTLDNQASRHGIEKAGFEEARRVDLYLVFGLAIQREVPVPLPPAMMHG